MIRRSTVIAAVAILLSLVAHFLGLSFTPPGQPEKVIGEAATEVIALGNAFEDVAEALSEPVQPKTATVPDPPVQTPPEPAVAETPPEPEAANSPTSEALVASANPQRVFAPDTGSAKVVKPATTEPPEPRKSTTPVPETVAPSGGDDGKIADATVTPPVATDTVARTPQGNPEATTEPAEAIAVDPVPGMPVSDAPQQLAALPVPVTPVPPVTPAPTPAAIPVVPPDRETVEPVPDDPAPVTAEEDFGGSDLAVAASPRPRRRKDRPSAEPQGARDGSTEFSELQFPPLIESPLTAYMRGQGDLNARQYGGTDSGELGSEGSRGPGNSDVTNYAGQVLVHLNRAPAVHVSGRGFARVFFEINPDGTLAWVDIIDGTGSPEIDRAAKAQIRSAAPFPRPPRGASRKFTFVYQIN
jgi:TonB family protein